MVEKSSGSGWWPELAEPFRQLGSRIADWFAPRSEARSGEAAYRVSVELPGVEEKDIEVSLQHGVLTVRGEKRSETVEEGAGYFFSEREYGRFERSFRLPADADPETVAATCDRGVLTVTIGRREPGGDGARKIPVRKG